MVDRPPIAASCGRQKQTGKIPIARAVMVTDGKACLGTISVEQAAAAVERRGLLKRPYVMRFFAAATELISRVAVFAVPQVKVLYFILTFRIDECCIAVTVGMRQLVAR